MFIYQTEEDYIPYPSVHEVNDIKNNVIFTLHMIFFPIALMNTHLFHYDWQVLGRKGPFPLILLPQFGGYWIEGTNHELSTSLAQEEPPLCPASQIKLESNSIAKIYRKHFLGKVRIGNNNSMFDDCSQSKQNEKKKKKHL